MIFYKGNLTKYIRVVYFYLTIDLYKKIHFLFLKMFYKTY